MSPSSQTPSTPLVFTFPETAQHVRSVMIDAEPWWVAADVCAVLEIANPSQAVSYLDEDERDSTLITNEGGGQSRPANIVNEPGLYSLILRSRKPQAKAFKRWITHEVIPSIRRTGSYSAPAPALPDLTTPQGVLALAQQFTRTAEQLVEADRRVKELEPKALAHDTLMAAQDGDVLVRQAAKTLGWRESDLRGFLLDEKLIYRRQRTCGGWEYDFYAAHSACFNAVEKVVEHTWGSCAHYTLHVTPRGMSFIQMRMDKRAAAMREALGGAA
ncbi:MULTISPECIES: BRO family protein [unclassified Streptomyces]|uniref:BRO family protein n=1 Tax=unclassified Streptomyces TaxID=2593676 RepID=UPI00081E01A8|nr:BRO family protein [Streptomyces sp. LcepLS]MYR28639.1 phage antirepressor protein [Streptomyces sp. SID4945]SCF39921.1 Phage antirepressor protein KilAC domain-containing protein [Streptomyces sp. LcepLS]